MQDFILEFQRSRSALTSAVIIQVFRDDKADAKTARRTERDI